MTEDSLLMWFYKKGFDDELSGNKTSAHYCQRAYEIGKTHAILGDDVRSFDYLSEEEILKIIKQ